MKKNSENILITRKLSNESPIWKLSDEGHTIIAHSFLEIIPKSIDKIPVTDVYFYYSKNAAKHFLNAADLLEHDLTQSDHAAMGSGTAQAIESHGLTANFIGQGIPKNVAASLASKYFNSSICFIRANESTQSIQKLWPKEYSEVIAYSVNAKTEKFKEKIHTIIATSPMNLDAVLKCCDITSLKRIICIGPTTYNAALRLSTVDIFMAENFDEQAMLQAYFDSID